MINLSTPIATSMSTIPELISPLRSAFRMSEFDKVEKILMNRESAMKIKYDVMEKEHGEIMLNKLEMEVELKELKRAKTRPDDEIEAWKNKFEELASRVLRLEQDVDTLTKVETKTVNIGCGRGNLGNLVQPQNQETLFNCLNGSQESGSGRPGIGDIIDITDSDDERPIGDETASLSSKIKRKRDSGCNNGDCGSDDNNTPIDKRKHPQELSHGPRISPENHCFATPNLGVSDVEPAVPSIIHNPVSIRRCEEKSEVRSSDSDEEDIDYFMDSMFATLKRKKENPEWEFEVDMLQEFARDDEVCLNALCALYRQQLSKETSMKNPVSSKSRGFSPFNALRGTALAKYLIDGDPQCKLKKTVSEVRVYDPKAIDDCRRLAIQQSKQLFEIYKKKEDPFFLPPRPVN